MIGDDKQSVCIRPYPDNSKMLNRHGELRKHISQLLTLPSYFRVGNDIRTCGYILLKVYNLLSILALT